MTRVVALDQVLNDSTGLPWSEVGVGILDGWDSTIRVNGDELGFFDICERDGIYFAGRPRSSRMIMTLGGIGPYWPPTLIGLGCADILSRFAFEAETMISLTSVARTKLCMPKDVNPYCLTRKGYRRYRTLGELV